MLPSAAGTVSRRRSSRRYSTTMRRARGYDRADNRTDDGRNSAEVPKPRGAGAGSNTYTAISRCEILELKNTVNTMVDQLASFAVEVTRVAREVGTEGQLGGQAD